MKLDHFIKSSWLSQTCAARPKQRLETPHWIHACRSALNVLERLEVFARTHEALLWCGLMLALAGCATSESRWAEVSRWTSNYEKEWSADELAGNARTLKEYAKKYPKSAHAQEAQERLNKVIERMVFVQARGKVAALENYLGRYPSGSYTKEAQQDVRELKEKERVAKELEDARRALDENTPAQSLKQDDAERARNLINRVNDFAGKVVQNDHDSTTFAGMLFGGERIRENPTPLFLLDAKTGKLTMRLTPTKTRELLLKDIGQVRPNQVTRQISFAGGTPYTENEYFVMLQTKGGQKIIKARNGDSSDWVNQVTLKAASGPEAAWLQSDLESLVTLFAHR